MKSQQMNPDAAIERVLTGLSNVEAPPEIEQRVLQAVRQRAAEQERPRFAVFSTLTQWQPLAIAACVVVLSFAASVAMRKRHEPRHEDAVLSQHTLPRATVHPPIEVVQTHPRQLVLSASARRKNAAEPEALDDLDALAISEMNAPSKPAPPLPLTRQEQLLAGAVRQGGSTELSGLRPEVRDKQMELSKAEFHDFFDPPLAKESE